MSLTTESRRLILLGSTGSIGVNALEVVEHLTDLGLARFEVVGLAAGANAARLADQARRFGVRDVAIADPAQADQLDTPGHVFAGIEAAQELVETVARPGDLVLCAMVGAAGVAPTLAAIARGCDIALANKETLVAAGALVMPRLRASGRTLIPIDSEHSAIAQCLRAGRSMEEVSRVLLTASGGPFRSWPASRLEQATVEEALNHPTWQMGRKVTIDSASMMNKALEIIEAHWLFGLPGARIEVIVHPQSIVHSFVEFVDGSVVAQLGPPDMRTPIQYALTWPHRHPGNSPQMDWAGLRQMDFEPVDHDRFPVVRLAYEVIERKGTAGAVFNAANEVAVDAFLTGRIAFGHISEVVRETLEGVPHAAVDTLADVTRADAEARRLAAQLVVRLPAPGPRTAVSPPAR